MQDFSRYVYPTQNNAVHVVDIASGADTVLPGGEALLGYVLAVKPDGVYGVPAPLTLRRIDWQGHVTDVVQGYFSTTVVVGSGFAYGSNENGTVHSINRIDLTTAASQRWFTSLTRNLRVVGLDAAGNPLIVGVAADGTASIWHPTSASTSDEPVGQPLGSFQQDPGTVTVAEGQGGFWIESTVFGLYHTDVAAPGPFGLVTNRTGLIAGPCV